MNTNYRHMELKELVEALKVQQASKKDFIVPSSSLSMQDGQLIVNGLRQHGGLYDTLKEIGIDTVEGDGEILSRFKPLDILHEHISEKLEIPKQYYNKMASIHPALFDHTVTEWFKHERNTDKNYLLRSFNFEDGNVARCLVSDRYKVIDNLDILFSVLEAVKKSGLNIKIDRGDITDKKMYLRFICPDVEIQAPELLKNYRVPGGSDQQGNPGIITGFVISNSETGHGGFTVSPRAVVLACRNGLVRKEDAYRQIHIGGKLEKNHFVDWSKQTEEKNMHLIHSQIMDCVNTFTSKDYLGKMIDHLTEAGQEKLKHPVDATKNVCKAYQMSDKQTDEILNYFIEGGQPTAFGLSQSLTYFAHETEDADLQYEMEVAGYDIVTKIKEFDKPVKK